MSAAITPVDEAENALMHMEPRRSTLRGVSEYVVTAERARTEILIGAGQVATRSVGLTIATVAGVVLIVSGPLMLIARNRQAPASVERSATDILVG